MDVTQLCQIRDRYQATRPVMAVLLLDNYEDLMKNLTENERSAIYSEINSRLDAWVADTHGMLRRVERDYGGLRSQVEATVSHAADELDKAGRCLEEVTRLLGEQESALEELSRGYSAQASELEASV